ncbi:MAG: hypothetical protein CMJ46_00080 [Planctomyces sp.]|nr:hypothetical protein [Planctomyces sp.]
MNAEQPRLWLDDERDPRDPFIQENYGSKPDDIWVKTVEEAIDLVKSGRVRVLSLDHDLGEGPSGYEFCKWFEEECFHGRLDFQAFRFFIHTNNPVGRMNMEQCLEAIRRRGDGQISSS